MFIALRVYCLYLKSWVRPCTQQPIVNLATSVCLIAKEMRAFASLGCLPGLLTGSPPRLSSLLTAPPSRQVAAGLGRLGIKLCWFLLYHCLQLSVLGITIQNAWTSGRWPPSSWSCPTSRILLLGRILTLFFPGPFLPEINSSFCRPSSSTFSFCWNPKLRLFPI